MEGKREPIHYHQLHLSKVVCLMDILDLTKLNLLIVELRHAIILWYLVCRNERMNISTI